MWQGNQLTEEQLKKYKQEAEEKRDKGEDPYIDCNYTYRDPDGAKARIPEAVVDLGEDAMEDWVRYYEDDVEDIMFTSY